IRHARLEAGLGRRYATPAVAPAASSKHPPAARWWPVKQACSSALLISEPCQQQFVRYATTTGLNRERFMADDRDPVEREHTTIVETGGGGGGLIAVVLLIIVVLVLLYMFRGQLGFGHSSTISVPNKIDVNVNHS